MSVSCHVNVKHFYVSDNAHAFYKKLQCCNDYEPVYESKMCKSNLGRYVRNYSCDVQALIKIWITFEIKDKKE